MQGLIEGRIVHFVLANGQHRAAIIVKVIEPKQGLVDLTLFVDGFNDIPSLVGDPTGGPLLLSWEVYRYYSDKKEPLTWHWIERE